MILFFLFLLLFITCWASTPQAQLARVVYLAPYDGDGSDETPFKARGHDASTGCIDRRPDPTKGAGYAICARATLPAGVGYITLSNRLDATMTTVQKTAIENNLLGGQKLTGSTVSEILAEVLISKAATKLRPGRDGKYHIWLGGTEEAVKTTAWIYDEFHWLDNGLVADLWNAVQPALAYAATLATETFPAADGNLAGAANIHSWSEPVGTGWTVASNRARNETGGGAQLARLDTSLNSDDFTVQATLVALSHTGGGFTRCGVMGRKDTSTTATYYRFHADSVATDWIVEKVVAGVATNLGTATTNPANGDIMLLRMDGSSISGDVNAGAMVSPVTDTAISGNNYGGMQSNKSTTTMTCDLDDVIEADINEAAFGPLRRRAS